MSLINSLMIIGTTVAFAAKIAIAATTAEEQMAKLEAEIGVIGGKLDNVKTLPDLKIQVSEMEKVMDNMVKLLDDQIKELETQAASATGDLKTQMEAAIAEAKKGKAEADKELAEFKTYAEEVKKAESEEDLEELMKKWPNNAAGLSYSMSFALSLVPGLIMIVRMIMY